MTSYLTESTLVAKEENSFLELATALGMTPQGLVPNPTFFEGLLTRPDVAAAGLLAVADVAASRYADAGLAKRVANLDPVVTAGGDVLRFESFSACNGVYARFDIDRQGLGEGKVGFGSTNVDINQPLRTALARTGRHDLLHLAVGRSELRASSMEGTHVERQVKLPDRWVRGFAEVPAILRSATLFTTLSGPAIGAFLGRLPRVAPPGPTRHLVRTPGAAKNLRIAEGALPGALPVVGTSRLRSADRVANLAIALTVYGTPSGSSVWVFDIVGGRFTLLVSPGPYRGFSGEGSLLTLLAAPQAESHGRRLLDVLGWNPTVDPAALAAETGLLDREVDAGLSWLAASGRLGYDLAEGAYFHRELPVDADQVLRRNPRLMGAHRLADTAGVTADVDGWSVRASHGSTYRVSEIRDNRGGLSMGCTCPWWIEHQGMRGPCKHVLAVFLLEPGRLSGEPAMWRA